jgi:CheY-like chemotaxis protein
MRTLGPPVERATSRTPRPPTGDRGLWTLLVVEDDELFARGLCELVEASGRFTIAGRARNGREAVEAAGTLAPDAVVMDIQMPILDGIEATRRLHERDRSLPIVLISGYDFDDRALEGRQAGASDYVRKGRIEADLVEALLAAIGRRAPKRRAHPRKRLRR